MSRTLQVFSTDEACPATEVTTNNFSWLQTIKQALIDKLLEPPLADINSKCKNQEHNTGISFETYGTNVVIDALEAQPCSNEKSESLRILLKLPIQPPDTIKLRCFYQSRLYPDLFFVTEPYGSQQHPDMLFFMVNNDVLSKTFLEIEFKSGDDKPVINGGFNPPKHPRVYVSDPNKYLIISALKEAKRITIRTKSNIVGNENFDEAIKLFFNKLEEALLVIAKEVDELYPGWRKCWTYWIVKRTQKARSAIDPFINKDKTTCHELSIAALDLFCRIN